MLRRVAFATVLSLAVALLVVGWVYAGSTGKIASGVRIAGIDVGGLTPAAAERLLRQRSAQLEAVPLEIVAGGRTFRLRASQFGMKVDWAAAAARAGRHGNGFGPERGFRRLYVRFFGSDVTPPVHVYAPALRNQLARISAAVDVRHREAGIRLRGLEPVIVPAKTGRVLDRKAAAALLAGQVSSLRRDPVRLPFRMDEPSITARKLVRAAAQVRTALSAPVQVGLGTKVYRVPPGQTAKILSLPRNGQVRLKIAGPGADAYFARLERKVDTPAKDARFEVVPGGRVRIVPSVDARVVDVPATAKVMLAAALSPTNRVAKIVVGAEPAKRTTRDAQAMGIKELVSSYTTIYGGIPNRIHNVQLVARLIDDTLIAPGKEFSFNETTGARTPDKGFLEAPVIINGELQTALGGGVCQVSTTVFNTAYEAGLKITARTNHALYISHYPQGRDATVNYPDTDLRFVNDTGRWLLLRTFVSASSLTVNLYGTSLHRRVESETAPLRVRGGPRVKTVKDPKLEKGKKVVEEAGSPSLATSVRRRVFTKGGKLLYDNVWYSSYRGETKVIRVGTKPKPKLKPTPGGQTAPPILLPT